MYNILDNIGLVQMSVQYTWQYMFSSNECTIFLTVYVDQWVYNILDSICLVQMSVQYTWQYWFIQMSVQYTWQYMFSSNEFTIYLTVF